MTSLKNQNRASFTQQLTQQLKIEKVNKPWMCFEILANVQLNMTTCGEGPLGQFSNSKLAHSATKFVKNENILINIYVILFAKANLKLQFMNLKFFNMIWLN